MGLPPQAARIAGGWPSTHEPTRRPARPSRTPWFRPTPGTTTRATAARVTSQPAQPARHA